MTEKKTEDKKTEEFVVSGDTLVAKVKELIKAGNVNEICQPPLLANTLSRLSEAA